MPKLPIDYSNTTIYKLVHKEDYDNANIYIGSTTDFIRRKNNHKSNCCNEKSKEYNEKKYQYIRGNGDWGEWNMIEVEKFPCNDKREAEAREEYWRCHFNSQLNIRRAYITNVEKIDYKKQFYLDNKDNILKQKKQYYEANKQKKLEYMKQYYYNKKNNITDSSSED
jgi:predicted GIY-YIG superfamily endonuclease